MPQELPLRQLREATGLTQAEAGATVKLSQGAIWRAETGDLKLSRKKEQQLRSVLTQLAASKQSTEAEERFLRTLGKELLNK